MYHSSTTIRACHMEEKSKSSSGKKVDKKIPSHISGVNHVSGALKRAEEHADKSFHIKNNLW